MTTSDPRKDPLNRYAYNIIHDHITTLKENHGIIPPTSPAQRLDARLVDIHEEAPKVGIIGAGIGGLYAAMLLQECGIPYEILEASPRLGGRLYTHRMGDRPNDYFDIGAMRYPDTPIMKPLFDLFRKIDLKLGEYQFSDIAGNSILYYNNINRKRSVSPITPQDFEITGVPARPWGELGVEANLSNVTRPFADRLIRDVETGGSEGWELMMRYDQYSMKAYMAGNRSDAHPEDVPDIDAAHLMPYPINVVNWCEAFDTSSSAFDKALTETVLESLAFAWDGSDFAWKYIVGGSHQLAVSLDEYMSKQPGYTRPFFNTRVAGISCVSSQSVPFGDNVSQAVETAKARGAPRVRRGEGLLPVESLAVHLADGRTKYYSHVITTTTLPCLRVMNLTGARLDWKQKEALRMLQYGPSTKIGYGPSTKIGVRFRRRWWEDEAWMKEAGAFGAILGGQSYSDAMSRTVVYPSFGIGEPDSGACMIVSYAWTNDALALTGIMGIESRDVLTQRILQDLVEIHNFSPKAAADLEQMLAEIHPYSWTTDPTTMGAFAFFGPGDFKELYPAVTRPAGAGRLHFAGEVCSVRHAWVVGALEASIRAVDEVLRSSYSTQEAQTFEDTYGLPEGWTEELLHTQLILGTKCAFGEYPPVETV
ncbi:hypothetical protein PHLGIDRAFT_128999 [Phlebiopsis gigantea 11061_1 CR5-6]|uniref:Amine oxidase domain-containing protein n=1 Tax=Phlebiopsis gigantea (strain 11061_1 CR5-6) TaxID=745531 RepID=A0A0C3NK02_PHLG1|nr:hypothetical protein PHLGIDRAFT_128999 [Phlebiopsis gigantea 11061_1 CR5-6]